MAKKLTKGALKQIVKECLVEILQEGFGNSLDEQLSTRSRSAVIQENSGLRRSPQQNAAANTATRRAGLADISMGTKESTVNEQFNERVSSTVNQMTDDPILSEILSDTARTTLQNQIAGEKTPSAASGDRAARAAAASDPLSIFADSAKNWSKLAFND